MIIIVESQVDVESKNVPVSGILARCACGRRTLRRCTYVKLVVVTRVVRAHDEEEVNFLQARTALFLRACLCDFDDPRPNICQDKRYRV